MNVMTDKNLCNVDRNFFIFICLFLFLFSPDFRLAITLHFIILYCSPSSLIVIIDKRSLTLSTDLIPLVYVLYKR
jgi:hypothetical protein